MAYAEQGRFQEAIGNLQKAAQLDKSPSILALAAHVHAVAGQKREAEKLLHDVEKSAEQHYFCPYEIGAAYVSLGNHDTAVKWFRKGLEDRADCMAWLGVEPWIESVPFGSAVRATIAGRRLGARLEEDTAAIATPTARLRDARLQRRASGFGVQFKDDDERARTPDGERFLVNTMVSDTSQPLVVVLSWKAGHLLWKGSAKIAALRAGLWKEIAMTRLASAAAFLLLLGLVVTPVSAQIGQGRLTGLVTDAQHAVLPGVTVVATSPALIGEQSTITQSDGRYLFPALPSGTYTLTFRLDSFQTIVREGILLSLATTITVDAEMALSSLQESVVVSGNSPVVDVATTKVGMNLKGDELVTIPNSTDIWGVLAESPGIRMQGFDVGGSHKSQQSAYEVFGIQGQARVISDGIDHTEGTGGMGFYEDYFANEEVSVSALGSDVEMNSGGAAIITTVKSGGDTFKGLLHGSYEPGRWVGDNVTQELAARGFTGNPTLLFWETHADLGGPIRRERAWFFYAFNHFTIDKVVSGIPRSVGTDVGIFDNHTAKATWRPSPANTVIAYFQQGRKQKPRRGISLLRAPESVFDQDAYTRMYKGEWQRVVSDRSFLDVIVGRYTADSRVYIANGRGCKPAHVRPRHRRVHGCVVWVGHRDTQQAAGQGAADALPSRSAGKP